MTTKIKVNLQARLIMKVFQPIGLPVRIDISECNLGHLLYIIKVIEKKDRTRNIFIKFFSTSQRVTPQYPLHQKEILHVFCFFKIISHHIIVCNNFQFAFRRTTFIIVQIFLNKPTVDLF